MLPAIYWFYKRFGFKKNASLLFCCFRFQCVGFFYNIEVLA
ncbi:hypothetical protein [Bacillus velezensis]